VARKPTGRPPGRPPAKRERQFFETLCAKVPQEEWGHIIDAALVQAKDGDRYAREWLGKYLLPPPGRAQTLPDGGPDALVKALEGELHRRALGGDTHAILASLRALDPKRYGPDAQAPEESKPVRRIVWDDVSAKADDA